MARSKVASTRGWTQSGEVPLAVIREVSQRDTPRLEALYAEFGLRPGAVGTGLVKVGDRQEWLKSMLRRGFNFVAEEAGQLVAHLVLIRIGDSAEMGVFVHPDYRRRGIGTALLRVALDQARDMGLRHVWVPIDPTDTAIQESFAQFGFVISRRSESTTEMTLAL